MKKLFVTLSLIVMAAGAWAVPAKPGLWKTLRLADGTEVKARLVGDEHKHYFVGEDGQRYLMQDDIYVPATEEQVQARRLNRVSKKAPSRARNIKKVSMGEQTHYKGQKKGIVILMQFKDTKFKTANNLAKYKRILNEPDYTDGNFQGSVADYFKAQSGGIFELNFDVVGPYTATYNASYYGSNDSDGNDQNAEALIVEALKAANAEVNFKDYDWDDDGEVDQVFVLYAGKGEADGGSSSTIWPHMYYLSETNKALTLDGVRIDTYACSNEVDVNGNIEGIGCFCHEFSHCMGFPDFYDIAYNGWFGMSSWDLMDTGSYNGDGFVPAGYSAYEKWMSGWLEPIELNDKGVTVENLEPISEGGNGYIIYNDGNRNEYYMVENRQKTGWDSGLPGRGLMITHVDFDKDIWEQNTPNTKVTAAEAYQTGGKVNTHQRFTIFHADNTETTYSLSTDLYPYNKKDSLTNKSTPKATLYNPNTDGTKLMNKPITAIKQNADRTMSFLFKGGTVEETDPDNPDNPVGDIMFYESFDKCDGTGANDGTWSTTIATSASKFHTDNEGWSYLAAYGGYQCARFGNASKIGEATTPAIKIDGDCLLTFKASGWNNDGTNLTLSIAEGNATLGATTFTLKPYEWSDYSVELSGTGTVKLKFVPVKRFLLDEVKVSKDGLSTAILMVDDFTAPAKAIIYTIDGRRVSGDFDTLPHGLYIINGKKVIR